MSHANIPALSDALPIAAILASADHENKLNAAVKAQIARAAAPKGQVIKVNAAHKAVVAIVASQIAHV
jgi:hypothetical protein